MNFLIRRAAWALSLILPLTSLLAAINPFSEGVRRDPPRSPSDQQKAFKLPPGFKIELVASEPEIAKPMNLAFDVEGRLWVTDSYEYPYAAPLDQPGRDSIKVLTDTNGDGRYDKIDTFAEGLNIPIGLYPYKNGVIAWSIPNITYFEDSDHDGRSDRQTHLFGPLGYERDTHGMNSSFTRGFDGWLYITHGFNNNTTIAGSDGHTFSMNSGNTYRVRLDGSRAEPFTFGQVNPFGMTLDSLGNLYTSDCHSMPAYLLIRDAYYPSFGKPHDGLGFCPKIMSHSHGSTAIDGVVYYPDDQWPAEYQDNVFIGNVMTSRVNRDTLIEVGSGKQAREEKDFIESQDSWFRPVNMQFGPDGSLYIADFYNRIIGHYEVRLDHPGRDRHRGRLWKVSYQGMPGHPPQIEKRFDLRKLSLEGIYEELDHPNLVRRQLAMNYLVDEIGPTAGGIAHSIVAGLQPSSWRQRVHSLWVLHRLGKLEPGFLQRACADAAREVRVHAMHVLSETPTWTPLYSRLASAGLRDPDFNVRRAAADAFTTHRFADHIAPLLEALRVTTDRTPHLRHTLRIALRHQLRDEASLRRLASLPLAWEDRSAIADVAIAIPSSAAAHVLLQHLTRNDSTPADLNRFATHIARHSPAEELARLPQIIGAHPSISTQQEATLYRTIATSAQQRDLSLPSSVNRWGTQLAEALLEESQANNHGWRFSGIPGMVTTDIPWIRQVRRSADGDDTSVFLSSLSPGGESNTGVARSPEFSIPGRLRFFIAGHDGFPERAAQGRNHLRLRLTDSDEIIAQADAPRNDTAQQVDWDLSPYQGRRGALELTDGDNAGAFAWLAVGRFAPEIVPLPSQSPQDRSRDLVLAAQVAAQQPRSSLARRIQKDLISTPIPPLTKARMAEPLSRTLPSPLAIALAKRIADVAMTEDQRQEILRTLFSDSLSDRADELAQSLIITLPATSQVAFMDDVATNRKGTELILRWVRQGALHPSTLQVPQIANRFRLQGSELESQRQQLVEGLKPITIDLTKRIRSLASQLLVKPGNPAPGKVLFEQACQVCHQINGQGALVGPQLDGIGNRGVERLLEDLLDPNRNVDAAFHPQSLSLENGEVLSGLFRREEGNQLILVNAAGAEFSVHKEAVQERTTLTQSLMPDNFGDLLEDQALLDLVTFLLSSGN